MIDSSSILDPVCVRGTYCECEHAICEAVFMRVCVSAWGLSTHLNGRPILNFGDELWQNGLLPWSDQIE